MTILSCAKRLDENFLSVGFLGGEGRHVFEKYNRKRLGDGRASQSDKEKHDFRDGFYFRFSNTGIANVRVISASIYEHIVKTARLFFLLSP